MTLSNDDNDCCQMQTRNSNKKSFFSFNNVCSVINSYKYYDFESNFYCLPVTF